MSKKFPGLTSEKIPQNAPQWISVCQKFPGSYLSKYLKVHQNGCQFLKKVREWLVKMAQNAPKWIFVFQKFPGGDTPGPPASVGTQTSFKRTPPQEILVTGLTMAHLVKLRHDI